MPDLNKIVLVGAGSYVFGRAVLYELFVEQRLAGVELALVDPDAEAVALMQSVGRRLAAHAGLPARITTHTEDESALDGADYVICAAAHQGLRRYQTDCRIIETWLPDHPVTEFGGIAGISYSLRQISLIERLVAKMLRQCPEARLVNVANPLPRVSQAAQELGVETIGLCSAAQHVFEMLWSLFGHQGRIDFPFDLARERWTTVTAGLNHCAWLLSLHDRATGEDALADLRQRVSSGATSGNPRCERLVGETGHLLVPLDDHAGDFLTPDAGRVPPSVAFAGTVEERNARYEELRAVASGSQPIEQFSRGPAWERPVELIAALVLRRPLALEAVNLVNRGQMPQLPLGVFVETPAKVGAGGLEPSLVRVPQPTLGLLTRTAEVTDTIVRAARQRSRELVYRAVELDPTIIDKRAGRGAIDACIEAHTDLLPDY